MHILRQQIGLLLGLVERNRLLPLVGCVVLHDIIALLALWQTTCVPILDLLSLHVFRTDQLLPTLTYQRFILLL